MAAVRPGEISRFLDTGWRSTPLVLLYGPDEGQIRTRAAALHAAILGGDAEAMNRLAFEADELNADPSRLLDEANAISMFGGTRVIAIASAGRLQKAVWQPLIDTPPLDSILVFLADDLARSSPLRVAIEQSQHGAAIACYPASRQDILAQIDARARAAGLAVTPAARSYLAELLGGDAALTEVEIEKLILYCHGKVSIEVADIDDLVMDSSDLNGSEPIDRAFEGKLEEIESIALRSFREGINPVALLSIALNHAILLRKLVFHRSSGTLEQAIKNERIHFRRADRVRKQVQTWDSRLIARAVDVLSFAQDQTRRAPSLDETIAIRALWSVALASRRR